MKRSLTLLSFLLSTIAFSQDFVKRDGNKIKLGATGSEIHLRGICFGNWVWDNDEIPVTHHNEEDYKRVKDMGMNAIRFYMNYLTFEDDSKPYAYKQSGWDWIDQNIAWAKKNGIYLILNIHIPPGGFQSQCKGDALWAVSENKKRLTALWRAIADRYKNETQIAGFDLLNEPTPSGTVANWKNLAQRLIDTIRTVDQNHLLIAERAIALGCDYGFDDGHFNFPVLKEDNLMYTVHFYEPFAYSHQNLAWAGTGEGGKYPDESIINVPADAGFAVGQYSNPKLPDGNSDWKYYEGQPFEVASDTLIAGRPVLYGHRLNAGKAYYDDIVLNEIDINENIRQIAKVNFTEQGNTWFWSEKNDGSMGTSTSGHGDNFSFTSTGASGYSTVNLGALTFKAQKGKWYMISGWMKGENIPVDGVASITTEFYYSPSNAKVETRNYEFLKKAVLRYSEYPGKNNYPVYFGEFGVNRSCFENERGGENWTRDMLHIFDSLGFNFTYHDYHEDGFGLYKGWKTPVDISTVNEPLKKTFEDFFLHPTGLKAVDEGANQNIAIYPNPSKGGFRVKNLSGQDYKTELLNAHGISVQHSKIVQGGEILIDQNLAPGVYYLLTTSDSKTYSSKLIKE